MTQDIQTVALIGAKDDIQSLQTSVREGVHSSPKRSFQIPSKDIVVDSHRQKIYI